MPGWERLLTSSDAAERAVLRMVLRNGVNQRTEDSEARWGRLEHTVARAIGRAF